MPTFSEITLTVTTDAVIDDVINIFVEENDVITNKQFTWVATRSTAGEVTEGTPTANAGETTVINLEAAYDLDNPTGYVTTVQNTNELLIQSETEGEDFIGIIDGAGNTLVYDIDFNNYIPPIDNTNIELALTRSPFYVSTPFNFDTTTKVTINVYAWSGDLTTVPADPIIPLTKIRPTIDYGEFNTNLSNIVQDELDAIPVYSLSSTTQLVDSSTNGVKWFKYVASYTDDSAVIADVEGTFAAVDGFGYYSEGVNPTNPSSGILTSSTYRKVPRSGFVMIPFMNNGTITDIDIDTENAEINATETPVSSNESSEFLQYLMVDLSATTTDEFLTIGFDTGGASREEYVFEIVDECRYNPVQVIFKNKYGAFDMITMFKKRTDNINVTKDEYISNYVDAGTYSTTVHQYKPINVQGKQNATLNSGYITEDENELYKELYLSDLVFFYEGGYKPVKLSSDNLELKTRVNDSLTSYTLEFEYAHNLIQNV